MGDSNTELIKAVVHYQQCLEKYTRRNNEPRMLYCIGKLYKMPITVEHLEQTGVGRTVNSLRKCNGEVGEAAKSLVAKWKEMVVGEDNESKDSSTKPESSRSHREESKHRKHREASSSSSHKESDKKSKHDCKEKSSSSFSNGEESHSKKIKEEYKHKKSEENYKKDKESNYQKHKSTKRKQSSDNSESDDRDYEKGKSGNHKHKSSHQSSKRKQVSDNSDSDDNEYEKMKSDSYYKHKLSKQKVEESEDEGRYKIEKDKRDDYKQKLLKRKREDSDYDDEEYEEINIKRNKYSEEESESEVEEKEVKSVSNKYQSKHKDELNDVIKEKHRHSSSKHRDKKEKKEHLPETQQKKSNDDHKMKDKSNKEKVKSNSEKKEKGENGKKAKQSSSKHHHEKEHKSPKKSSSQSKGKVTVHANGIGSDSGTSFAEALGMLAPSSSKANKKKIAIIHPFPLEKPIETNNSSPDISKAETSDLLIQKRLEPLDINISNLLPEITPNYRPIGNSSLDNGQSKSKITAEEEALSAIMYSKISRTKVYSGNKVIYNKVPTLFDLCTHVLQDNIDALEYTGGVPYTILKPVIERANPDQLFMLEHHNPYLIEDTDELWQLHCQKQFRNKKREEMETWRDMYMRCLDEREAKLKALTANIKQSQDKSIPVRQTKLAYVDGHSIVKPPRSIARKQAKHGTAGVEKKPLVTPSSRLSALATAGAAGQIAVPNPGSRAASAAGSSSAVIKPKKAPLMQKTLAFMKNRLFRR